MKESEYLLVSNLAKLNLAAHSLSEVTFLDDERQERVKAALAQARWLADEIYMELDGKIEKDPE